MRPSPVATLPERWTPKIARRLLAECDASGSSVAQFARDRGVRADRLKWWRKRLARAERAGRPSAPETAAAPLAFVPAIETPAAAPGEERVVVRLPGGIEVEAASAEQLPPAWLAAVARAAVGD